MTKRTKEQKELVNNKHCFFCFKLRTAILLTICFSFIMLIVYGYEFWYDQSIRADDPARYFMYVVIVGIEFISTAIGWIAIYNHIRSITKYYNYYIIVHTLIITIIFLIHIFIIRDASEMVRLVLFGIWVFLQLLALWLIHRFKQVLKMIYGWGAPEEEEEEIEIPIAEPPEPQPQKNKNSNAVNVSINLNMPSAQTMLPHQQPVPIPQYNMNMYNQPHPIGYVGGGGGGLGHQQQPSADYPGLPAEQKQQPLQPSVPQMSNSSLGANSPSSNIPLKQIQNNPPQVPQNNNIAQSAAQPKKIHKLSDIAQQADPPPLDNAQQDVVDQQAMRLSVYSQKQNDDAISQQDTIDNDNDAIYQNPNIVANNHGNDNDKNEQIYNTSKWQTNQYPPNHTNQQMIASSVIMEGIEGGGNNDATKSQTNNPQVSTPDPPKPPLAFGTDDDDIYPMNRNASDNDVLYDDFIADVQPIPEPKRQQTKGVNLYFLDPGKNGTKGGGNNY